MESVCDRLHPEVTPLSVVRVSPAPVPVPVPVVCAVAGICGVIMVCCVVVGGWVLLSFGLALLLSHWPIPSQLGVGVRVTLSHWSTPLQLGVGLLPLPMHKIAGPKTDVAEK